MTDLERIETICENLKETLIKKNKAYGNSAFQAPLLCPYMSPASAILVRMSDKINRFNHLTHTTESIETNGESIKDTVLDLAGYCVLYLAFLGRFEKDNE